MFINHSSKQVTAKIVYYGPGLSGKTTNLQYIFSVTNPKSRGELVSIETDIERTLFFDLLPLNVGLISGYQTRFQLYTVPGQVFYDSTRRLVLKGADGIVFVADSQELMLNANIESLENLRSNLENQNQEIESIPLVFQFNKRDLKNLSTQERLNEALNRLNRPHFSAVATKGAGVIETLREISGQTLKRIKALLDHSLKKDTHLQAAVSFDMDRHHEIIRRDELPVRKIQAAPQNEPQETAPVQQPASAASSLPPSREPLQTRQQPPQKTLYDSDDMQKSPIARDPLYETSEVFQLSGFEDINMADLEAELDGRINDRLDDPLQKPSDDSTADLENPLLPLQPKSTPDSAKTGTPRAAHKTEPEFIPPPPQLPLIAVKPETPSGPPLQPTPQAPAPRHIPQTAPQTLTPPKPHPQTPAAKAKVKTDAPFDLLAQLQDDSRLTIIKALENLPDANVPITVEIKDKDRLLLKPFEIQYNPKIKKITIILDVKK